MLKILDIYIIKKFLGTFFYAIALIIGIVIIFDISEKIDDFIEREPPLRAIIFDYYMNFIPYFANLFMALFTFIAVIFFTSNMASNSEIIAILSNGVSYKRLMLPYFISSLIIAILSYTLINFIIPPANKVRLDFEENYYRQAFYNKDKNIHRQIDPGVFIYMESYNNFYDIGYKFSIEKFEDGKLKSKLVSNYIKWDTTINKWKIHNYHIRHFDGINETIEQGRTIDTVINIHPSDFSRRLSVVETMNYWELNDFIDEQIKIGADNIEIYLIEKYKRFAFPFSTFILTLIGVTLSSRKTRGGVGINIGIGLLIAFTYIMFIQVSTVLSTHSNMDPLIAVWIPNILFAIISIFLYKYATR
ncbi:MAG: LptF/LptG family permease [Bacteroidales bacterium]|nr:LptF/LptG family permease [Bacteroidales bacterium]